MKAYWAYSWLRDVSPSIQSSFFVLCEHMQKPWWLTKWEIATKWEMTNIKLKSNNHLTLHFIYGMQMKLHDYVAQMEELSFNCYSTGH